MPSHTIAERRKKRVSNPRKTKIALPGSNALSPEKAKIILEEGQVRGTPLTEKQKGFFRARAAGEPVRPKLPIRKKTPIRRK